MRLRDVQEHQSENPMTPAEDQSPAAEYRRRRDDRRAALARQSTIEKSISALRLGSIVALGVVAWLSLQSALFSPVWSLLPVTVFIGLVIAHRLVLARCDKARRAEEIYEDGLARIEDRWIGRGKTGDTYSQNDHLYADDLDLFGDGSLFQLLATTRSRAGDECLASWLKQPADDVESVRRRQEAVAELRSRLDFRERLFSLSTEAADGLDSNTLAEWSRDEIRPPSSLLRVLLLLQAAAQVCAATGWAALGWGPTPLLVLLLVLSVGALVLRRRIRTATAGAAGAGRDLAQLRDVLSLIERESFSTPDLRSLQEQLLTEDVSPVVQIDRLRRLIDLLDSARNPIFVPIAILLVWTPQLSLALEAWRSRAGGRIWDWVQAAGRMEATAALATYAYENPDDPFPELDSGTAPVCEGTALGHPLLPKAVCVRNDLRLDGDIQALVISGSNMSGKSTYLRTVGINIVMALAGAPVRAQHMRLSLLAIGASIQIRDSLQAGHSRFYREILRVRDILELTSGPQTTLFLLDEILHGTNSHDRRIGAKAIVRSLLGRGAIGLMTTHDLALAEICDDPAVKGRNVHFEDEIADGEMTFDYKLREGVVEKSNAIELMRQIGLEV